MLNPHVIYAWEDILTPAFNALPPLQRKLVQHYIDLSGCRKPTDETTRKLWSIDRKAFDLELDIALVELRCYLRRHGIHSRSALESE